MKGQSNTTAGPLAAAASYILNILLFPATLTGYVLYVGYLYLFGRTPGVSTTAQGPLSVRWAQHHLSTREGEAANRLMTALPGFFAPGWYLVAVTMLLAHRHYANAWQSCSSPVDFHSVSNAPWVKRPKGNMHGAAL